MLDARALWTLVGGGAGGGVRRGYEWCDCKSSSEAYRLRDAIDGGWAGQGARVARNLGFVALAVALRCPSIVSFAFGRPRCVFFADVEAFTPIFRYDVRMPGGYSVETRGR